MSYNLADTIKDILYGYVKVPSFSFSSNEKNAEKYFLTYFEKLDYFKNNPQYFGAYPIADDPFDRAAVWAMVKGKGNKTVVLIHHYDVVGVEDYKLLRDYAFTPDELEEELLKIKDSLHDEAKADLESKGFLFGRGVCDMKGGGAIQMALLSQYSMDEDFVGNVIVLGVPDEETLSAGMRSAVILLSELKDKYGLEYKLMINSEPHQRKNADTGVFSFGSIGKLMPFIYVRGYLAHAGKVFEGLNPSMVMGEIVRRTEMNMDLSDVCAGEAAPPPTWLYLKDSKNVYDVSMPLTVNGCLSVLTLNQTPGELIKKIKCICENSFQTVIDDMNRNYSRFLDATGQPQKKLPWQKKVIYFKELYKEAEKNYGRRFKLEYEEKLRKIHKSFDEGKITIIEANFQIVDFIYEFIDDLSPTVVIGLMPPYYPNVANIEYFEAENESVASLYDNLLAFTRDNYNQSYTKEYYYTGISDLSYSALRNSKEVKKSLTETMPFFGHFYSVPVETLEEIAMPCVNIGPWGKDFHKVTERVYKEDLYTRTPEILDYAIKLVFSE